MKSSSVIVRGRTPFEYESFCDVLSLFDGRERVQRMTMVLGTFAKTKVPRAEG